MPLRRERYVCLIFYDSFSLICYFLSLKANVTTWIFFSNFQLYLWKHLIGWLTCIIYVTTSGFYLFNKLFFLHFFMRQCTRQFFAVTLISKMTELMNNVEKKQNKTKAGNGMLKYQKNM